MLSLSSHPDSGPTVVLSGKCLQMIPGVVCRKGHRASFIRKLPPCVSLNLLLVILALIVPGHSGPSTAGLKPQGWGSGGGLSSAPAHRKRPCLGRTVGFQGIGQRAALSTKCQTVHGQSHGGKRTDLAGLPRSTPTSSRTRLGARQRSCLR